MHNGPQPGGLKPSKVSLKRLLCVNGCVDAVGEYTRGSKGVQVYERGVRAAWSELRTMKLREFGMAATDSTNSWFLALPSCSTKSVSFLLWFSSSYQGANNTNS